MEELVETLNNALPDRPGDGHDGQDHLCARHVVMAGSVSDDGSQINVVLAGQSRPINVNHCKH